MSFAWRFVATGLGFLAFGICGTVFSVVLFPLALLWPQAMARQRAVTSLIHLYFRAFVRMLRAIGVMQLEVRGDLRRATAGGAIVIANHPTYLDVMVLLSLVPSACCLVKNAHWRNPCFYGIVRAANYVSNADAAQLLETSAKQLQAGYSMIVFPEGTRSPGVDRLHPFSRGFAHMALAGTAHAEGAQGAGRSGPSIVPVLIDCDPPVFTKALRWYHVPPRPFRFRIVVLEPVRAARFTGAGAPPALAARALASGLETHMTQHLIEHGFIKAGN
jgi:1-acyl-sn-glycerol-3-phosphate acyltransferase